MSLYYALGNALVSYAEIREKEMQGSIASFNKQSSRGKAKVEFSTGELTTQNRHKGFRTGRNQVIPFKEVGIGKPLAVEIRHLFTGRFPKAGLLGRGDDIIVTSAMKSIATFNAAPRAVNFYAEEVSPNSNLTQPGAVERGTPIVYYSPALTEYNSVLTIEIAANEFDSQLLSFLENAFRTAAGIPLFMSAGHYLMAASTITRIAGRLGDFFIDRGPIFSATETIEFLRGGAIRAEAGFALLTDTDLDPGVLAKYSVAETGQLVDARGHAYRGDQPYVVISLDGHANDSYQAFAPTAASAALLERFFKIHDSQTQDLGPLTDALKLYNDWMFRKKADSLKSQLERFSDGSPEQQRVKVEYEAAVANILNEMLRPA